MRLSQAVFVGSVRDILTNRNVDSFCASESPTRADGYGYDLEAGDAGVFAKHPKAPGTERFIPWANVKWVDVQHEEAVPKPEHWKTRQARERREAANAVQE